MKRFLMAFLTALVCMTLLSLSVTACAEEPIHLIWWTYSDSGDAPTALPEVLERANAISAEKIGVTVDMQFKTEDQFQLDLNTGEYYDMTFSCDWCNDFDGNAMKGYYYDLTDLVQSETPELYNAVEPWWEVGSLGGRVYGVPMLKDMGAEVFFTTAAEQLISDLEARMGTPEVYANPEESARVAREHREAQQKLDDLYELWEELSEAVSEG